MGKYHTLYSDDNPFIKLHTQIETRRNKLNEELEKLLEEGNIEKIIKHLTEYSHNIAQLDLVLQTMNKISK